MMKPTHILSGAILAQGYLAYLGLPMDPAYIAHPKALAISLPSAAACLLGATFPDIDMKLKIFGHRTVTHWFPPYLLVALFGWFFMTPCLVLFCAAALLHIFLDAFTKMGVPMLTPFGSRRGFRLFATGGAAEMLVIVALLFGAAGIWHFWA